MKENSILSILILLFIFFIVPSILKFLGQYTLNSKQPQEKRLEPDEPHVYEDRHHIYEEDEGEGPDGIVTKLTHIQNKPIEPRWF